MKNLESLKKYKMSDTNIEIIGGARYTGSFTCGGTSYTYDGEMYATNTSVMGANINYSNDFTGCISRDGHGCYSTWVGLTLGSKACS